MEGTVNETVASETRERLQSHFVAAGCDYVVLTLPANVAYASGYRSIGADIMNPHAVAVVVGTDETYVVTPAGDVAALLEAGYDGSALFPYGRFYFEGRPDHSPLPQHSYGSYRDALGAVLERLRPRSLGIDAEPAGATKAAVSAWRPRQIQDWMYQVRAEKTPGEISMLTKAAQLAEESIQEALSIATVGVSEIDLARRVARTMVDGGGHPRFVVVTAGERSALADARPSNRSLGPGDLIRFDVGCQVGGYWSDIGRTAVMGPPSTLQESRYRAILEGESAQMASLRPGMIASDLFDLAVSTVEAAGLAPYRRHHCGHAIGLDVYERPIVSPNFDMELTVGMVLCLETPFYELGWGGMMVEDAVLVTEDGCTPLTRSFRGLRVIE